MYGVNSGSKERSISTQWLPALFDRGGGGGCVTFTPNIHLSVLWNTSLGNTDLVNPFTIMETWENIWISGTKLDPTPPGSQLNALSSTPHSLLGSGTGITIKH